MKDLACLQVLQNWITKQLKLQHVNLNLLKLSALIVILFKVECCSSSWRPADHKKFENLTSSFVSISIGPVNVERFRCHAICSLFRLQNLLSEYLVGQHIAQDLVVRAVRGHARFC